MRSPSERRPSSTLIPPNRSRAPDAAGQEQIPDDLDDPGPQPGEKFLANHQVVFADEAGRFPPLAAEGPDDSHPAKRLGRLGVDLLPLLAHVAVQRPEPPVPEPIRDRDRGRQEDRTDQEAPIDPGQDGQPAQQLDDRSPGVEQHAEDQLADSPGIFPEQTRDPSRLELIDPVQAAAGTACS